MPIHDISGAILFYRLPLKHGKTSPRYVDGAMDETLGEPLLAISIDQARDRKALLADGAAVAHN